MNTLLAAISLAPVTDGIEQAALAIVGGLAIGASVAIPLGGLFWAGISLWDWFRKITGHEEEDMIAAEKRHHEEMEELGL